MFPDSVLRLLKTVRLRRARGFGVKEAGTSDPVTPSTLFEAQSISKAVTATAALV